jgi:hypothetical protein
MVVKENMLLRIFIFFQQINTHPLLQSKDVRSNWEYEYGYGASNELYTGSLSSDFLDMTFPEVAE